jgi:predicted metal-dependent TIM-barrel fold hydrolase
MKLIDSHIMMDSLGVADLEAMAAGGITGLIADAAGGMDVATSSEAALQYFERILGGETIRAADYVRHSA